MERPLESRTISQAIQTCMELLAGRRIVVVMGDRLALTGICLAPFIAPGLMGAGHNGGGGGAATCAAIAAESAAAHRGS